jgi:hypothetical protein
MHGGTISGNTASGSGGGVYISYGGGSSFTMHGGTISGNTASSVGGVYVDGAFTMQGGAISNNTASSGSGGGVYVSRDGAFTMQGGTISNNTASSGSGNGGGYGGGVYVDGTFTMQGGTISNNTASAGRGGGVYVDSGGAFTKADADDGDSGIIYGSLKADGSTAEDAGLGNTASAGGHAVYYGSGPKTRNATLGAGDDISTTDTSSPPWD